MNVATVFSALASVIWIIFVGLIVLAVVRASRGQKVSAVSTSILVTGILALVITSVSAGVVFIQPEERGVVISAVAPEGYRPQALQPGLNWIIPFLESVTRYDISRQTYTMSATLSEGQVQGDDAISARTSDGQEVNVDASVIFAVDPSKVVQVHIEWQDRFSAELVRPVARGVIRDAIAQYQVEEVYSTRRTEMTDQIRQAMSVKLGENGLILVDFVLRNITFSPEYAASVEQKQIAEQQAEQAKFVVEQRKQEAEQARQVAQGQADSAVIQAQGQAQSRVIQAQAEAEALEAIATAVSDNQDLLYYLYINKINPAVQVMMLPNNVPYLLPLPTIGPPLPGDLTTPTAPPTPTPLPTLEPTPTP
jgi:regulator of protease activity HflC (stomatin/prohibitin superfamily)